jgi:hypothetical protein
MKIQDRGSSESSDSSRRHLRIYFGILYKFLAKLKVVVWGVGSDLAGEPILCIKDLEDIEMQQHLHKIMFITHDGCPFLHLCRV